MKCEFQSIEELMEYVEMEAERRAREILEKHGMELPKFKVKSGAVAGTHTQTGSSRTNRLRAVLTKDEELSRIYMPLFVGIVGSNLSGPTKSSKQHASSLLKMGRKLAFLN